MGRRPTLPREMLTQHVSAEISQRLFHVGLACRPPFCHPHHCGTARIPMHTPQLPLSSFSLTVNEFQLDLSAGIREEHPSAFSVLPCVNSLGSRKDDRVDTVS